MSVVAGYSGIWPCSQIREVKAEDQKIQSHSWIHGELKASLGHIRPCLRKAKKKSVKWELSLIHLRSTNLNCLRGNLMKSEVTTDIMPSSLATIIHCVDLCLYLVTQKLSEELSFYVDSLMSKSMGLPIAGSSTPITCTGVFSCTIS